MDFLTVTQLVTCPVFSVSYPYKTRSFGHRPFDTRDVLTAGITPKRRSYQRTDNAHHDMLTLKRCHKA